MSDLLGLLLAMNLAAAVAIAVGFALRLPVRWLFGPRLAYGLWALPPLAALAMLIPERTVVASAEPDGPDAFVDVAAHGGQAAPTTAIDVDVLLAIGGFVWLAGVIVSLALLALRQARFAQAARDGIAGPAVVGVLRPRIVAPDDFADRYTPREQEVVLAHERTHIARHDSRVNAAVAIAACFNWFNPLIHLLAHYLRIDQELACDAEVVAAHPKARRAYAEAMLKTQLAARPLPMGCYWPEQSMHPLAERIRLLGRGEPPRVTILAGAAFLGVLAMSIGVSAWAAKPPRVLPPPPYEETLETPAPGDVFVSPKQEARNAAEAEEVASVPAPARPAVARAAMPTPAVKPEAAPQPSPQPDGSDIVSARAPIPAPPPGMVLVPAAAVMQAVVEPAMAVRLVTTVIAPDGRFLDSRMTTYGSRPGYRYGAYDANGSRYDLRTKVVQAGDKVHVFVNLISGPRLVGSGMTTLASGETGEITLSSGQQVVVTPTVRPETRAELRRGQVFAIQARAAGESVRRYDLRSCRIDDDAC